MKSSVTAPASILFLSAMLGCGGDSDKKDDSSDKGGKADQGELSPSMIANESQTPPMGEKALEAWLSGGAYKKWNCESDAHAARSPSPHGANRVCSNDLLGKFSGTKEYPVGSAGVKELVGSDGKISGYAVYLKTKTGGGEAWYWYERTASGVVADGQGNAGAAKSICVGCHQGAGSDAQHSGHDQVYTQVMPGGAADKGDMTDAMTADASQTPPMEQEALEAWLTEGSYKSWKCESSAHAGRSPSPHGQNRICSNDLLSKHDTGEYPVGAASVKELFDDGGEISGYAVLLKTKAGAGEAFYWYERTASGVVADGQGDMGAAKTICVGCHAGAGSDADHSGHDLIYTQVK